MRQQKLDLLNIHRRRWSPPALAMTAVLKEQGITLDITAGWPGRIRCHRGGRGMDPMDAIRLVRKRGILDAEHGSSVSGSHVRGDGSLTRQDRRGPEGMEDVTIANYNCPGQIVITGKTECGGSGGKTPGSRGRSGPSC